MSRLYAKIQKPQSWCLVLICVWEFASLLEQSSMKQNWFEHFVFRSSHERCSADSPFFFHTSWTAFCYEVSLLSEVFFSLCQNQSIVWMSRIILMVFGRSKSILLSVCIFRAAKLVGLNVLQIMNANTAGNQS